MPSVYYDVGLFKDSMQLRVRDLKGRFAKVLNSDDLQMKFAKHIGKDIEQYIPIRSGTLVSSTSYTLSDRAGGVRIKWRGINQKSGFDYTYRAYTAASHDYPAQKNPLAESYWDERAFSNHAMAWYEYGKKLVTKAVTKEL